LVGEHRGRRLASSLEFADYRPYTPGDDFRRIDWNAYARLDNLLVKIPEAREDVTIHLLLDVSRSMAWGEPSKLDYARQVCAGLGYMALCRLDAVRVGALGATVAARSPLFRGKAQTSQLFRFLQRLPVAGQTDLNAALRGYVDRRHPTDVAILVSDLLSPSGYEPGLDRLLHAGLRVAVIHLLAPDELEPGYAGDLQLVDVETGAPVEVSLGAEALRRYQLELASWQEEIRACCRSRGLGYHQVRTDRPIEQTLLADFRRAGLLR
ncbi:MAG: DUF58 domain-containing protein, partial [Chloroflexi bacterium]|nr:DUF58 domain-containing protein [Chloroflexota bacterium]